jgi:hypothetical protein
LINVFLRKAKHITGNEVGHNRQREKGMSISTFIIGESGTGKTASLRNLNPEETVLIQAIKKPLPFRSSGWKPFVAEDKPNSKGEMVKAYQWMQMAMESAVKQGRKVIIIDDFQYLMSTEFMKRSDEKGYGKFTELARHAWEVVTKATSLPNDVRVYILSHIQTGDDGIARLKTIGKLLDEKITLEGMVTIVLRTAVMDGSYLFRVKNSGSDTVKTPIGMFDTETVENDLKAVDDTIRDYYGIK